LGKSHADIFGSMSRTRRSEERSRGPCVVGHIPGHE
jgi:hypothetical protein